MFFAHVLLAAALASATLPIAQGAAPTTVSNLSAIPAVGDIAPDFMYKSFDSQWRHLSDVLEQGDVLLLFGAKEEQLRALETESGLLLERGILPFAVVEQNEGTAWSMVQRLDLSYSLLSDPKRVVASQYGAVDGTTGRAVPSWFVVDRAGRICQSGRDGIPTNGLAQIAAAALGRAKSNVKSAGSK